MMENKKVKFLSLLSCGFTEEFFKDQIGSGIELKELEEKKVLSREEDIYIVKDPENFAEYITQEEKRKFLLDIIQDYYKPKLDAISEVDYKALIVIYPISLQLSAAYLELEEYDLAINSIFRIAKRMIYWGKKNDVRNMIERFPTDMLSSQQKKWKEYYILFSDIMINHNINIDNKRIQELFTNYSGNDELEYEIRNLEAIYNRIYRKDIYKAIEIHERNLERLKKETKLTNSDVIIGRNYENLAFCYINSNVEYAIKNAENAEMYFKKANDNYELCKLYYNLLNINIKKEENMEETIKYLKLSMEILNEFYYPDLLRNIINLFADYYPEKNSDLDYYFKLKVKVLQNDLLLYTDYFISDFISIVDTIKNSMDKDISNNIDSVDQIINFLEENRYIDEFYFMKGVKNKIKKKSYKTCIDKIKNSSLKELFNEIFKNM